MENGAKLSSSGFQLKNLKALIIKGQARKEKKPPMKREAKNEIRIRELEDILVSTQTTFLRNRLFDSPLSLASRYATLGDETALREQLDSGHNVNARDPVTGRTVLIEAISGGHFQMVRMLCADYKANVHIRALLGNSTPLHIAVECGFRQIASILITFGADVNAVDKRGCLPLHLIKHSSLAKLLFRYPVNPLIRTREGLLPSQYYEKYVLPPDFDLDLHQYLIQKEEHQEIENFRARTAEHKGKKAQLLLDMGDMTK